ncbi:MAG: GDP-mannose 4,6-dehydratase [Nanoarchaeota archaeon]|nr:GDP-mannose 4,6-dehydratase [Nanoarchaeota archaeon]
MKKALITGITGQDGSYLAEFLLSKGYEVHGIMRRSALEDPRAKMSRIHHLNNRLILHTGDLTSYSCVVEIMHKIKPDECYHLAAQSFVHESFEDPFGTFKSNIDGTLHMLTAIRRLVPSCKFYFAASSEMFGKVLEVPQKETTRFYPRSPYGVTKVTGYELTRNYRESYNLFACSGILFNHESPRRGYEFVTRKITQTVARIKVGKENVLVLGNLDARRDWGFAGDYVKAMWMMLQQPQPDDYVIATGENYSVRDFVNYAFQVAGLQYEIVDLHHLPVEEADRQVELLKQDRSRVYLVQHPRFYRPAEVDNLLGDSTKAREKMGWRPEVSFQQLVQMMVQEDIRALSIH